MARLAELGGRPLNLYRALAHHRRLLDAWIEFAWALRQECSTPRAMRELMILRGSQIAEAEYEWHQHRRMASEAGVRDEQVEALAAWRTSDLFDDREKAALALTEAITAGHVPDEVDAEVARHFSPAERVELILTAGFYVMVPRVLDALRVPIEDE